MIIPQNRRASTGFFQRVANLRSTLFVTSCLAAWAILVLPTALRPTSFPLVPGDVAPQDIQAPYALSYASKVLTEQASADAEMSVNPVYLPADPAIARQQIERMRLALNFMNTVRLDAYADNTMLLDDLAALSDVTLSEESGARILSMNDTRWQMVQKESLALLEQVMRSTIRENRVDETLRNLPSMVSYALPEEQSSVVVELVSGFIVPNSLYSPDLTEKARQDILAKIETVDKSYVAGETIVYRGQVITASDWEALDQFGLVKPVSYRDKAIGAGAFVLVIAVFVSFYSQRRPALFPKDIRNLALIALLFLFFLLSARLILPNRTVIPYLFPLSAFGLTLAVLFNAELGLIFTIVLSILTTFNIPTTSDLPFFFLFSGLCGVLVLGRAQRVVNFFWAGIAVGLVGAAVVLAFRVPDTVTDWLGIATLAGGSMFNGLAAASLALLFQFLFAQALGLTTALQLLDISRPDHPLLQYLLRRAPGTYQHSLQVANLAEQAAETIGADTLLTRVGALYHDCGKAENPQYFIENQVPGDLNPHDGLDPLASASTILTHVTDGQILAQKHHLPPRIRDFILEHHGTRIMRYQYTKALEAAAEFGVEVDPEKFRYPGPRPHSRETALLMLADGCEARARADRPKDEQELRKLIKSVFDHCQKEGQLDDTALTLFDLNRAYESFVTTLKGAYHPRITYPEMPALFLPQETVGQPTAETQTSST